MINKTRLILIILRASVIILLIIGSFITLTILCVIFWYWNPTSIGDAIGTIIYYFIIGGGLIIFLYILGGITVYRDIKQIHHYISWLRKNKQNDKESKSKLI
ncbi:MAG: hypothetical protein Ta2E_07500 [Mycoplasmoidaceae bacterium]|nr:MAG: hypothetical protein Ta2E_07500 [Mycoplasmoidaceae bacterium]